MTNQPPISPDSSVLVLRELKIPGRTGPTPTGEWGINIAAALDNFPRQGLQCQAGPWGNMDVGDKLVIFWSAGNQVLQETVDQKEKGTELTMFIPAARIADGVHDVSYSVTRLGGTTEPSEAMKVFVKLNRPGGQDQNGDTPGHSELHMTIPKEILDGGIDKDNVADGVPITIQPYPHMAAGDVIQVTWGGKFVLSEPLTEAQVKDPANNPIVVLVDEATIRDAGDSDSSGLAVAFEVYDVVDNRSEDWSAEQRVVVGVDKTRLTAPILKEAQNNVLDVDKLGDADGTVQILAIDNNFKLGDIIFVRVRGTPVEGAPVDLEIQGEPLDNVPSIHERKVPNAVLKQLAKTQVVFSYRLKKADGSADLQSKGQFIRFIGEIQRLKAPIAEDAQQGAIDPELPRTRIEIPFDKSFAAGQAIKLFWLGTRPDFGTYLPDLPLHPITKGEIEAGESLFITVAGEHLTPIKGGTLELYYQLLIEDTLLATFNRVNATHAIRESLHLAPLQVGEPRLELPEPKVEGVVDGVLPPDRPGTTLTVEYLNTVKDDVVTYEWVGSKTGTASDWVKLSSFTAGQPVPFNIKAELIKGNEGGTVAASYSIKRAAGGTSFSNALTFSVGAALELKPASVKEANGTSLNPVDAQKTLTILVPHYTGMLGTDKLSATWAGTPGDGSHTSVPVEVGTVGIRDIPIPNSVVAFNLGKPVTVTYTVTRNGTPQPPSEALSLAVQPIQNQDGSLTTPIIDGFSGAELDITNLVGTEQLRVAQWPLQASGQCVWLRYDGIDENGAAIEQVVWEGVAHNALPADLVTPAAVAWLKTLKDGSDVKITFKVNFDKVADAATAVTFPLRTYTVRSALTLNPPSVKEASGASLSPIAAKDSLTVVVPQGDLLPTDLLSVTWSGSPGDGSHTTKPAPISSIGREIQVPVSVIAFNLGKPVTVSYTVTRNGTSQPSQTFSLNVLNIPEQDEALPAPKIPQASDDKVLDLNTFEGDASVTVEPWPFSAARQRVWLTCTRPDGDVLNVLEAYQISAAEAANGLKDKAVWRDWLQDVPMDGRITVEFKITLDGSEELSKAVVCPVMGYTVKRSMGIIRKIKVGTGAGRIVINRESTKAYVTHANFISVIDLKTYTVHVIVDDGQGSLRSPRHLVLHPSKPLLYVSSASTSVIVIDTERNLIVSPIPIRGGPNHGLYSLAINKDGSLLYVGDFNGFNSLIIINTETGKIVSSTNTPSPVNLFISPDDRHVYNASDSGNSPRPVAVHNSTTGAHVGTVHGFDRCSAIAFSPWDKIAYGANYATYFGNLKVLSTETFGITKEIYTVPYPLDIAFNPVSRRAYIVTNSIGGVGADSLVTINTDTYAITDIISDLRRPLCVVVNHTGTLALVSEYSSEYISVIQL
ncbi:YncE family protein [Pseudomonas silensiensis]|uniref:YncE family protein n=1 Tax=Pseudomonas silensiensis TaxID=2991049 RepID=UPI003D1A5A9C